MFAKLFFMLVALLFGLLAFLAGMMAPEDWKHSAVAFSSKVPGLASVVSMDLEGKFTDSKRSAASTTGSAATAAVEPASTAVDLSTLLIPTPLPEKASYALRVSDFATASAANAFASEAKAAVKFPVRVIEVVDATANHSWLVAIGAFNSIEDARAARFVVNQELNMAGSAPLILLPPAKAAGAN